MALYGRSSSRRFHAPVVSTNNEPAGMTTLTNRPFNALNELTWADTDEQPGLPGGQIITDATAPHSPSNILRTTLPSGMLGGGGTMGGDFTISGSPKTIYFGYWARWSANWQGGGGIHKQIYAYNAHSSIYVDMFGTGGGPFELQIAGQDILAGGAGFGDPANPDWGPNLAAGMASVGVWYYVEVVLTGNSNAAADGAVDTYLNGVHVGSHTGIQWSAGVTAWNLVHYTNLWNGGTVPNTQSLDFDHIYVSGK